MNRKYSGIWEYILDSCNKFYLEEIQPEGWHNFSLACIAKMLHVTFLLAVGYQILPLKNIGIFENNLGIICLYIILCIFWKKILKDRIPHCFDDLITGEIYFKVDKRSVSKYIYALMMMNALILFCPIIFTKLIKRK